MKTTVTTPSVLLLDRFEFRLVVTAPAKTDLSILHPRPHFLVPAALHGYVRFPEPVRIVASDHSSKAIYYLSGSAARWMISLLKRGEGPAGFVYDPAGLADDPGDMAAGDANGIVVDLLSIPTPHRDDIVRDLFDCQVRRLSGCLTSMGVGLLEYVRGESLPDARVDVVLDCAELAIDSADTPDRRSALGLGMRRRLRLFNEKSGTRRDFLVEGSPSVGRGKVGSLGFEERRPDGRERFVVYSKEPVNNRSDVDGTLRFEMVAKDRGLSRLLERVKAVAPFGPGARLNRRVIEHYELVAAAADFGADSRIPPYSASPAVLRVLNELGGEAEDVFRSLSLTEPPAGGASITKLLVALLDIPRGAFLLKILRRDASLRTETVPATAGFKSATGKLRRRGVLEEGRVTRGVGALRPEWVRLLDAAEDAELRFMTLVLRAADLVHRAGERLRTRDLWPVLKDMIEGRSPTTELGRALQDVGVLDELGNPVVGFSEPLEALVDEIGDRGPREILFGE